LPRLPAGEEKRGEKGKEVSSSTSVESQEDEMLQEGMGGGVEAFAMGSKKTKKGEGGTRCIPCRVFQVERREGGEHSVT